MDSKYCSGCLQKLLLSSFLADASANPGSKVFATCILCRDRRSKTKRKALHPLDPNIQPKKARSTAYKSTYTSESFDPPSQSCRSTSSSCRNASGSHYPSQSTRITSGSQ